MCIRDSPNNQLYQHYRPIEPDVPKETILVRWLEAEGPFYDDKTVFEELVEAYEVAKASDEELDEVAEAFLKRFSKGAFRGREVSPEFVTGLHTYYKARRRAGKSFREAMVDPLALILSSPRFLYLIQPTNEVTRRVSEGQPAVIPRSRVGLPSVLTDANKDRKLDAISLANRLAAFLWSGPPDEELMSVAADGSLLNKAVLLRQTERMLSHPRTKEFYQGFASQWMHLKLSLIHI